MWNIDTYISHIYFNYFIKQVDFITVLLILLIFLCAYIIHLRFILQNNRKKNVSTMIKNPVQ